MVSLQRLKNFLWAAFLLTLPVSSFPYFPPALGGDALVRPLSLYPLMLLLLLFVVPRLLRKPLPKTIQPFFVFIFIAAASSLVSLLRGIEPAFNITIAERSLRGLLTLLVGASFYLASALLPDSIDELRFSLRWIYAGGSLSMLWGSIQTLPILHFDATLFEILDKLQRMISIRKLLIGRISGMTYEPHWFADQLILLILPGTLAAALTGYSVFRWRKGKLSLEWFLLGWLIVIMPFTYSRAGLVNLIITILVSIFIFFTFSSRKGLTANHNLKVQSTLKAENPPKLKSFVQARYNHFQSLSQGLFKTVLRLVLVAIVILIPIFVVGTRNEFFARIWLYWQKPDPLSQQESLSRPSLYGYITHLGFDTRLAYSEAAYNTFTTYPWLGVGLGNYGFYVQEMLPLRPMTVEVLRAVSPERNRSRLVTAKNFYLRILAETGVIGAAAFLAFIIATLGNMLYLVLSPDIRWKYWGLTSLIGMIAFLISALTFDSFAIPNMWVVFGLTTAAMRICQREEHNNNELTVVV